MLEQKISELCEKLVINPDSQDVPQILAELDTALREYNLTTLNAMTYLRSRVTDPTGS